MVETLAETLREAQAKRHSQKQGDVEIEALINIMADTLLDRQVKTFLKTLRDVEAMKLLYTLADTEGETQTGNLQHTLAITLAEGKKVNTWQKTGQFSDQRTVQNPGLHSWRNEGQNALLQTGQC